MLPKHSIFRNALLLTAIDLLLRGISMSFQIYLSGVIGAAGLGLLQLVAAVGTLGMTLGLSGVRTAAMYLCAEEYGKRRPGGMRHVMRLCILWSSVFSILTAAALWGFSNQLAAVWLKDLRAASGLRILALSLPVECLVCVLCGYFTACGKLRRLACVEVAERLVSLALTFLLLRLWAHSELERACCSLLLGGGGAAVFSAVWLGLLMRKDFRQYPPVPQPPQLPRRLCRLCIPLALGDYLRSGLRTLEQLLIPLGLERSGGSTGSAMAAYGTIHAMVFPILMFPAAIIFSLSELLIPELARCRAEGNSRRILHLTGRSLRLGPVFACGVSALQFLLARPLGMLFYQSEEAGHYLRLFAPLIVILYADALVDGMCKGLGQQTANVRNNTITSLLDVALLYLLLPRWGIGGYFFTFVLTHALNFYLSLRLLLDASGSALPLGPLAKTALCALASAAACLLLPERGQCLLQILRTCGLFLAAYLPLLYLTGALVPNDRRWLRRTLSRGKGH